MAEGILTRMESFPFDSRFDGYDGDGYPVYDRAVGSLMLRETYKKFFTNGVFPSPGTALAITKGASGLTVLVNPGIAIINGAMGGVVDNDPLELTLDTAAPQGNVCYAIMLRYDNTGDRRSLYFNVVKGEPQESPVPPTPDTTTPEVYELRLGYITVLSGSTNVSEATVTNEKGTSVCPFAAPFVDLDMSYITEDAKQKAEEAMIYFRNVLQEAWQDYGQTAMDDINDLRAEINTYMGLIQSALDETTAGNLQNQINQLSEPQVLTNEEIDLIWLSTVGFPPGESGQGGAGENMDDMTTDEIDGMFE